MYKRQVQYWAHIIAGLGILFIGMNLMSDSMMPLRDSPTFVSMVANFSNPLIGILVGAGFTALIQSLSLIHIWRLKSIPSDKSPGGSPPRRWDSSQWTV